MPNHALLNNVEHKNLRVIQRRGAAFGDGVMSALTFPSEFRDVQAHYPIVFRKTDDGSTFEPHALFGFEDGENLFLDGERWDAAYVPLMVERHPFLIGRHGEEMLVHVDLDHPRVSSTEGEPVFLPYGGVSAYLERVNSTLLAVHQGVQANRGYAHVLLELELLERFSFDIELNDGSLHRLIGFYTIHEERLAALDGAVLQQLSRNGYLQAIYMVVASMPQFRALIGRKNHAARS